MDFHNFHRVTEQEGKQYRGKAVTLTDPISTEPHQDPGTDFADQLTKCRVLGSFVLF